MDGVLCGDAVQGRGRTWPSHSIEASAICSVLCDGATARSGSLSTRMLTLLGHMPRFGQRDFFLKAFACNGSPSTKGLRSLQRLLYWPPSVFHDLPGRGRFLLLLQPFQAYRAGACELSLSHEGFIE